MRAGARRRPRRPRPSAARARARQRSWRRGQPKRVAGARGDERSSARPVERRPLGEVEHAAEGAVLLALGDERPRGLLAEAVDVAEPDPHGAAFEPAERRGAAVHVGRQHLDPAALRRRARGGRRVEAHRLGIQERAEEVRRVVVAQPRALVGEQARTRPRATSGSRTRRNRGSSRRRARRSRARHAVRAPLPRRSARGGPRSRPRLRLRLIARRSPSASPTVKPASAIGHGEHLVLEDDRAERLRERTRRGADGRAG